MNVYVSCPVSLSTIVVSVVFLNYHHSLFCNNVMSHNVQTIICMNLAIPYSAISQICQANLIPTGVVHLQFTIFNAKQVSWKKTI